VASERRKAAGSLSIDGPEDLTPVLHHLEIAQRPTVRYGTPTSFEEVEVCLLIGTIDADIALEWLR